MLGAHGPTGKGKMDEEHPRPLAGVGGRVGEVGSGQERGAS